MLKQYEITAINHKIGKQENWLQGLNPEHYNGDIKEAWEKFHNDVRVMLIYRLHWKKSDFTYTYKEYNPEKEQTIVDNMEWL